MTTAKPFALYDFLNKFLYIFCIYHCYVKAGVISQLHSNRVRELSEISENIQGLASKDCLKSQVLKSLV